MNVLERAAEKAVDRLLLVLGGGDHANLSTSSSRMSANNSTLGNGSAAETLPRGFASWPRNKQSALVNELSATFKIFGSQFTTVNHVSHWNIIAQAPELLQNVIDLFPLKDRFDAKDGKTEDYRRWHAWSKEYIEEIGKSVIQRKKEEAHTELRKFGFDVPAKKIDLYLHIPREFDPALWAVRLSLSADPVEKYCKELIRHHGVGADNRAFPEGHANVGVAEYLLRKDLNPSEPTGLR